MISQILPLGQLQLLEVQLLYDKFEVTSEHVFISGHSLLL